MSDVEQNSLEPDAVSDTTMDTSDSSGISSPMDINSMEESLPTSENNEESSTVFTTTFSEKTNSKGQIVANSIVTPRLTANGKRVGRPPGTFKSSRHREQVVTEKVNLKIPIICKWESCNMEFPSVNDIVEHMKENHSYPKSNICKWDGCNLREFKSYYMLIGHLRSHTGERPNKCTWPNCTKSYKTKENLTTHIRTHTGEKPFACQFENCPKRFSNASDRGKHENRCHSEKKDYFCDVGDCAKSYTDPSSLRKHILCIHGPEALEKRKKVKVRWFYRRDGQMVDENGNLKPVEKTKEIKQEKNMPEEDKPAPIEETQENNIGSDNSAFKPFLPQYGIGLNFLFAPLPTPTNGQETLFSLLNRQLDFPQPALVIPQPVFLPMNPLIGNIQNHIPIHFPHIAFAPANRTVIAAPVSSNNPTPDI